MNMPGLQDVKETGLFDDDQYRWIRPLLLEGLTATKFRSTATKFRRAVNRRPKEVSEGVMVSKKSLTVDDLRSILVEESAAFASTFTAF